MLDGDLTTLAQLECAFEVPSLQSSLAYVTGKEKEGLVATTWRWTNN